METFTKHIIGRNATIKEALIRLDNLSDNVLTLFVLDGKQMVGTVTDGDIRRALIRNISLDDTVKHVMNSSFRFICPKEKNIQKIREIKASGVQLLPCLGENGELLKIYNLKTTKSILPVDAVLMAGGKGERLRPLTEKTPKPLLKIGEKAIIDYNVGNLISYGVENIHVTTNYLAEQLEEHFAEEKQGIKINCVREKEYLGTIASIKFIPDIKNDEVLVMNSDLFTNIDFEDFYHHFLENNADMSAAAIPYSVNVPYGIFELEGRNIQGVKEKPTFNYYANAGIYLIKKSLLDLIPDGAYFNATDFMGLLVSQGKKVIRYPLIGYWIDIGKPADYQKAQDFVKHISQIDEQ
jgi:dTDP-glucose pyrophosphorylase